MKKTQEISKNIADEIYRKHDLQLKKNQVIGEIESLLKKHPSLNNNISFALGSLTLKDAKAVLSIILNELKQINIGWNKTYKKEYRYFIQEKKQNNIKSFIFLFFILLLAQHSKKLKQVEKIKELRIKALLETDISDFIIKKSNVQPIGKIKGSTKNRL